MEDKVIRDEIKGDFCDYGSDFKTLSSGEKRGILQTANCKNTAERAEQGQIPDCQRRKRSLAYGTGKAK